VAAAGELGRLVMAGERVDVRRKLIEAWLKGYAQGVQDCLEASRGAPSARWLWFRRRLRRASNS
jgi:hypothetical protein